MGLKREERGECDYSVSQQFTPNTIGIQVSGGRSPLTSFGGC